MAIKITGTNVYLRLMQESDVATISTCLQDIKPLIPNSRAQTAFWWRVNKLNSAGWSAPIHVDDRGTITFTLCKKSDDSILGWNQTTFSGTKFTSFFSALVQAQRGNGYYSEMSNLRHKFFFSDNWGGQTSRLKIATTGDTNNPLRKTLDSLYTTTTETVDLAIHGEYRWSEVTKDEWTTWINHSDRAILKNQAYTLEWS